MKIYTKTGDEGYTARPGGERILKAHPCCEAVGTLDELNAHIGHCIAACERGAHDAIRETLGPVQEQLFAAGAMLSAAGTSTRPFAGLREKMIRAMETRIDEFCAELPELKHFIHPGGCELACRLHLARTVCRRAERQTIRAVDAETRIPVVIFHYLNRLSDLLFVLARAANHALGQRDVEWIM